MQARTVQFGTPRPVLQGQPVSVMSFGSQIQPPPETGYGYLPGTILSSVAAVPQIATFGTSKSPSTLGGLFSIPPVPAGGVPFQQTNQPTQGNGVPTIAAGNVGRVGSNPYSFGPAPVNAPPFKTSIGQALFA